MDKTAKLNEKKMNELLGEEPGNKKTSEEELLEEENSAKGLVDEVPAGVHPLKKPIRIDGEEVNEITYDLDQLSPIQYINLVKRLSKKKQIAVPEVDMDVQISYFALSSGIPVTVLKSQLATDDYTQICGLVRTFLIGASAEELAE